jgi:hypothetical protein
MSRLKLSVKLRDKIDNILLKYEDESKFENRPLDVEKQLTLLIKMIPAKTIRKVPQNAQTIYKYPLWESIAKAGRIISLANLWDIEPQKICQYIPNQEHVSTPYFQANWDALRKDKSKNIRDMLNLLKNNNV